MAKTFKTVQLTGNREARVVTDGPTYIARIFIVTNHGASVDTHSPTGIGPTADEALENLKTALISRADQFIDWAREIHRE